MYLLLRFSVFIECIFEWNAPSVQFSSLQLLSRVRLFGTPWISGREASLSITNSRVHSNSHPSSRWSHPAISSSAVPFPSCPQSFPASESFPMSQLFAWGGQSTGLSQMCGHILRMKGKSSCGPWGDGLELQWELVLVWAVLLSLSCSLHLENINYNRLGMQRS